MIPISTPDVISDIPAPLLDPVRRRTVYTVWRPSGAPVITCARGARQNGHLGHCTGGVRGLAASSGHGPNTRAGMHPRERGNAPGTGARCRMYWQRLHVSLAPHRRRRGILVALWDDPVAGRRHERPIGRVDVTASCMPSMGPRQCRPNGPCCARGPCSQSCARSRSHCAQSTRRVSSLGLPRGRSTSQQEWRPQRPFRCEKQTRVSARPAVHHV